MPGKLSNKSSSRIFRCQAKKAGRALGSLCVGLPEPAGVAQCPPLLRGSWHQLSQQEGTMALDSTEREDNAHGVMLTYQETGSMSLCIVSD